MKVNCFSDEDQEWIKVIKEKFPNACIIFYFLNCDFGRYSRGSFMRVFRVHLPEPTADKANTNLGYGGW
jgi:hypothetical protein